jgi:hypothetical protein
MLFAVDNSNVAPWFILDVLLVQPSLDLFCEISLVNS